MFKKGETGENAWCDNAVRQSKNRVQRRAQWSQRKFWTTRPMLFVTELENDVFADVEILCSAFAPLCPQIPPHSVPQQHEVPYKVMRFVCVAGRLALTSDEIAA